MSTRLLDKVNIRWLLLLMLCYQLLFVFWGFEFSDTGFNATFYQQIFHDPRSVQHSFSYWLTGVVGGIWLALFGNLGILGIRVLGVLVATLTVAFVYLLLRHQLPGSHVKCGLLLAVLLLGPSAAFIGLEYNLLTAFLFVVMSFLIVQGIATDSRLVILLAGVTLSLNVFARLPNLTGLAVMLPMAFFCRSRGYSVRATLATLGSFLGGFGSCAVAVLLVMKLIHHDRVYMAALAELISTGSSTESHGIGVMAKVMFSQYLAIVGLIAACCAVVVLYLFVATKAPRAAAPLLATALAAIAVVLYPSADFLTVRALFVYVAALVLVSVWACLDDHAHPDLKLTFVLGLMMIAVLPLGSDHGFLNWGGLLLFIALPASAAYLLGMTSLRVRVPAMPPLVADRQLTRIAARMLVLGSVATSVYAGWFFTYCEARGKHNLVYPIESPLARLVYTSKERSAVVNELLAASAKYLEKDAYVIAYDEIPMVYYLTQTKPYLYGMWVSKIGSERFRRLLEDSLAEKGVLPVIVKQKVSTWGNWPAEESDDYLEDKTITRHQYLADFQAEHGYELAWENAAFQIWVTPRLGDDPSLPVP